MPGGSITGAIGCLSWNGEADLNIAICTLTLAGTRDHLRVGRGIVAHSGPKAEYQETLDKGRALDFVVTDRKWSGSDK